MIAALEGKKRRNSTVRLSRMGFGSTNSKEKCIHDTGCECITVIGKTEGALGIDSRSSTRSMLNFKLGGRPEMQVNALVGVLYLGIQDGKGALKVMRTPAVFNNSLKGIFITNTACQFEGGIKVESSSSEDHFYDLLIPTSTDFSKGYQLTKVGVSKEDSQLVVP